MSVEEDALEDGLASALGGAGIASHPIAGSGALGAGSDAGSLGGAGADGSS